MMLGMDSKVASDPGGEARRALDGLPVFECSMPINYVRACRAAYVEARQPPHQPSGRPSQSR